MQKAMLLVTVLAIGLSMGCAGSKPTTEDLLATAKKELTRGSPSEASRYCRAVTRGLSTDLNFKAVDGDFYLAKASISGQDSKIYFFIREIDLVVHPTGKTAFASLRTNYVKVSGSMRSVDATSNTYYALYQKGRWELGVGEKDGKSRRDSILETAQGLGINARNGGARSKWNMPMDKIQAATAP